MRVPDVHRTAIVLGAAVKRATSVLGVLLLVGLGTGCASTSAPPDWLPRAEEAGEFPYGGWITVTWRGGQEKTDTHGELLAVSDSSLFVLETAKDRTTARSGKVREIAREDIEKAKLMVNAANLGPVVAWSTAGTISTLSHGIVLLLSAPLWILVGTGSTVAAADEPQTRFPKESWDELRKFARFPQGLPEGVPISLREPGP